MGNFKRILLCATETYSKITNWQERDCVFFGDGAGAVILENSNDNLFDSIIYSDGRGKENFTVRAGGSYMPADLETVENKEHYYKMNGKAVYETGTKVLPECIKEILLKNDLSIEEVDFLIPHQPSIKILKETADKINLPFDKVGTSMQVCANTACASIPVTMDMMHQSGKIKKDNVILFAAVGSGWTWGSAIIKWKGIGK